MEELKTLVALIKDLPALAIWVIAFFFAYKVIIVGSAYGVIRFVASRLFDWLSCKKVEYKEVRPLLEGVCITGTVAALIAQVHRVAGKGLSIKSSYIHTESIEWLRAAIDEKIERDKK